MSFYTLEKYRGTGLGTKLVQYGSQFFDFEMVLSGSEGTKKVYENSGGKDLGDLNRYIGILDKQRMTDYLGFNFNQTSLKFRSQDKFNIKKINKLDVEYDKFWNKVKVRYPITINRTREYLSWRFISHPLIEYSFLLLLEGNRYAGYAVIRFEDNNKELKAARVVDLIVFEEYEEQFLHEIINFCKSKVDFIDFFCTGKFYKKAFEKNNFFNNLTEKLPIPLVFNPIDTTRRSNINFFYKCNITDMKDDSFLDDVNNWYLVKADSDQDRAY